MKPLICQHRPEGSPAGGRLGRIIREMDRLRVGYQVWISEEDDQRLRGWGNLRVETAEGLVWCRVAGEVFRPNMFEFSCHSFWLTRRGMILAVAGLLEERTPQERLAAETFIQPAIRGDRKLMAQAAQWLGR